MNTDRHFWPEYSPRYYWRMWQWRRYWDRRQPELHGAWAKWLNTQNGPNPWPL